MVQIRSNLANLVKEYNEKNAASLSIRQLSVDIEEQYEVVRRLYNDDMERYPRRLLEKLCSYFNCRIDSILIIESSEKPQENSK
ncbi:helix-turn-helix domain-containing protein [Metabacillus endolithicus]|uniref:Helix-turn-helix domain-containing protein n=2 Tax=Metabacillus endolithicus TaxID=1535204 RepID=A0ABW5C3A1_9BACI|nr:helix-turn-helix transcriptional regulator [Metabacillus endolithicus]UPG66263.1 helix-turn-helix transcriptional regulator [Metabacillus endolithicus]